ncbi:MAG: D-2-hydroxyacid dehydrogenase [Brevefilum sp.]
MPKDLDIICTFELTEKQQKRIRDASDAFHLSVIPAMKAEEIPEERWAEADVLYTLDVLPEPEKAPNLKWVQFNSAGVDKFVDHPLLQKPDMTATTMSGVITGQIAEYVLMTMLAFGQQLPKLNKMKADRVWPSEKEKWADLMARELRHSTVGILGYGSIGRQVARLLEPFGATVLAAKKDVMHPEDKGYIPEGMGDPHGDFFDRLYPIEAINSMLKESDFVVVALPLTDETHHLLDEKSFQSMPKTAYLINVGRGELVDQKALIAALREKQIAGAALDVFEEEPLPEDSPLWDFDNVILSPHIAGLSHHLQEETLSLFIENLNRYLAELPLYNRVDLKRGY